MIEYIDKLTPDPNAPNPSDYETQATQSPAGASLPPDFPREGFTPEQLDTLEHYYHKHLLQLAAQLLTSLTLSKKGEATLEMIGANVHMLLQALGLVRLVPISYLAAAVRIRKDTLLKQRRHLLARLAYPQPMRQLSPKQIARALRTTARALCDTEQGNACPPPSSSL